MLIVILLMANTNSGFNLKKRVQMHFFPGFIQVGIPDGPAQQTNRACRAGALHLKSNLDSGAAITARQPSCVTQTVEARSHGPAMIHLH
jgi:hypothetical protein